MYLYQPGEESPWSLKSNLVILDGPRCSGKSTLGTELAVRLQALGVKAEYFKKGLPLPDEYGNMIGHLETFRMLAERGDCEVRIIDRFVLTELVFALYTGRTFPEVAIDYCRKISAMLDQDYHARHFLLLPPLKLLEQRMKSRPVDHSWDMPKERIHGLWSTAARLCDGVEILTTAHQGPALVDYLTNRVLMPRDNKAMLQFMHGMGSSESEQ